jgi:hypothetical protein
MVYLKEAIVSLCFYAEIEARASVNRVVILWCDFLLREYLKAL